MTPAVKNDVYRFMPFQKKYINHSLQERECWRTRCRRDGRTFQYCATGRRPPTRREATLGRCARDEGGTRHRPIASSPHRRFWPVLSSVLTAPAPTRRCRGGLSAVNRRPTVQFGQRPVQPFRCCRFTLGSAIGLNANKFKSTASAVP